MAISNFLYDMREVKFVLKEWLDMGKLFSFPAYCDYYGVDDIDPIVDTTFKIARDVVGPIAKDTDLIGARFIDGKVVTPDSFKKALATINEAGLGASNADREVEGRLPYTIYLANLEMMAAVNLSIIAYWGLSSGAISVIQEHGSDYLKQKFLPKLISGEWGGTMNLTEAGAGSDVGANMTKAFPTETPGVYKIKGNKIFITTGDNDTVENIVHMVLARIEGARDGVAGLSLFIVPKYWIEDDGRLGKFNDVICTGIEEKMGVHGQPTCSLSYGENNECYGYLIGNPPDDKGRAQGIAQMFTMMNEERLITSFQGLSSSSEAYLQARDYAKQRIQGTKTTDPKGPKVRIIEHEDIRRMLLVQKATTEAMRALIMKTCYYLDLSHDSQDAQERQYAEGMFQISNPMCKAYATDQAWMLIRDAIQTFGGYGVCTEYEVESLARDVKVSSIWEGTNYVQSLDLIGRKFTMEKGQVYKNWISDISGFIAANNGAAGFEKEFAVLSEALADFQAIMQQLQKYEQEGKKQMLPLFATRMLDSASQLYCGRLILDQGLLADSKLKELGEDHFDAKFYKGKVASARFYVKNVVPQIGFVRRVFEIGDTTAIDIEEECFG